MQMTALTRQAWLSCEVLKARPDDKQLHLYGLFATISNLRSTRNGVNLRVLFCAASELRTR